MEKIILRKELDKRVDWGTVERGVRISKGTSVAWWIIDGMKYNIKGNAKYYKLTWIKG